MKKKIRTYDVGFVDVELELNIGVIIRNTFYGTCTFSKQLEKIIIYPANAKLSDFLHDEQLYTDNKLHTEYDYSQNAFTKSAYGKVVSVKVVDRGSYYVVS